MKVQAFRAATLLKRDSNKVSFLWIVRNFVDIFFIEHLLWLFFLLAFIDIFLSMNLFYFYLSVLPDVLKWVFFSWSYTNVYEDTRIRYLSNCSKYPCPKSKNTTCRLFSTRLFFWQFRDVNPLSTNPTKWSNTLKHIVFKLPTNCRRIDHFMGLTLKELRIDSLNYINQCIPNQFVPSAPFLYPLKFEVRLMFWRLFSLTKVKSRFYFLPSLLKCNYTNSIINLFVGSDSFFSKFPAMF